MSVRKDGDPSLWRTSTDTRELFHSRRLQRRHQRHAVNMHIRATVLQGNPRSLTPAHNRLSNSARAMKFLSLDNETCLCIDMRLQRVSQYRQGMTAAVSQVAPLLPLKAVVPGNAGNAGSPSIHDLGRASATVLRSAGVNSSKRANTGTSAEVLGSSPLSKPLTITCTRRYS